MKKKLRYQALGILALLVLQFALGMILNLFITVPSSHPGTTSGNYFDRSAHSYVWAITNNSDISLLLHALIGTLLLITSVTLLVRAIMQRKTLWIWVSLIGALSITAAFANGLSFLNYNHDANSFIMAIAFIVAVSCYIIGIFAER